MIASRHSPSQSRGVARLVRRRIECGGERLWRFEDFGDLPFTALAKALSRLTRAGAIHRVGRGVYYRSRPTAFGRGKPNPAAIQRLSARLMDIFPSGIAAANLLGFTAQNARNSKIAAGAMRLPHKLIGQETVIHIRRPEAWASLSETDAAFLDFLRHAGRASKLSPEETVRRTVELVSERGRFERLLQVADSEPPRVRAILGALGEQLQKSPTALRRLRDSLNPSCTFVFGNLAGLPYARAWRAKKLRRDRTNICDDAGSQ